GERPRHQNRAAWRGRFSPKSPGFSAFGPPHRASPPHRHGIRARSVPRLLLASPRHPNQKKNRYVPRVSLNTPTHAPCRNLFHSALPFYARRLFQPASSCDITLLPFADCNNPSRSLPPSHPLDRPPIIKIDTPLGHPFVYQAPVPLVVP